jgi:hypothetical protein
MPQGGAGSLRSVGVSLPDQTINAGMAVEGRLVIAGHLVSPTLNGMNGPREQSVDKAVGKPHSEEIQPRLQHLPPGFDRR